MVAQTSSQREEEKRKKRTTCLFSMPQEGLSTEPNHTFC